MKTFLLSGLFLIALAGCSKNSSPSPSRPVEFAAQINGQDWQSDSQQFPYTMVDADYSYTPMRYKLNVEGRTMTGVPTLKLSRILFSLAFTYLPKLGHHPINSGVVNAKRNYCQAIIWYDAPDGGTYHAQATAGSVDITEIANGYVGGTFELTCPAYSQAIAAGTPAVLTVTKGRFYDKIDGPSKQALTWDGEQ
jgi:hypothetical protein